MEFDETEQDAFDKTYNQMFGQQDQTVKAPPAAPTADASAPPDDDFDKLYKASTSGNPRDLINYHVDKFNADPNNKYKIDPDFAWRIADRESIHFDPDVVSGKRLSPKGAIGMMQLMQPTANRLGVDPRDPIANVRGGISEIGRLLQRYNGDQRLAAAAYNAGEGAVSKYGGAVPEYQETQDYVNAVAGDSDFDKMYKQMFGGQQPAPTGPPPPSPIARPQPPPEAIGYMKPDGSFDGARWDQDHDITGRTDYGLPGQGQPLFRSQQTVTAPSEFQPKVPQQDMATLTGKTGQQVSRFNPFNPFNKVPRNEGESPQDYQNRVADLQMITGKNMGSMLPQGDLADAITQFGKPKNIAEAEMIRATNPTHGTVQKEDLLTKFDPRTAVFSAQGDKPTAAELRHAIYSKLSAEFHIDLNAVEDALNREFAEKHPDLARQGKRINLVEFSGGDGKPLTDEELLQHVDETRGGQPIQSKSQTGGASLHSFDFPISRGLPLALIGAMRNGLAGYQSIQTLLQSEHDKAVAGRTTFTPEQSAIFDRLQTGGPLFSGQVAKDVLAGNPLDVIRDIKGSRGVANVEAGIGEAALDQTQFWSNVMSLGTLGDIRHNTPLGDLISPTLEGEAAQKLNKASDFGDYLLRAAPGLPGNVLRVAAEAMLVGPFAMNLDSAIQNLHKPIGDQLEEQAKTLPYIALGGLPGGRLTRSLFGGTGVGLSSYLLNVNQGKNPQEAKAAAITQGVIAAAMPLFHSDPGDLRRNIERTERQYDKIFTDAGVPEGSTHVLELMRLAQQRMRYQADENLRTAKAYHDYNPTPETEQNLQRASEYSNALDKFDPDQHYLFMLQQALPRLEKLGPHYFNAVMEDYLYPGGKEPAEGPYTPPPEGALAVRQPGQPGQPPSPAGGRGLGPADPEAVYQQVAGVTRRMPTVSSQILQQNLGLSPTEAGQALDRMQKEGIINAPTFAGVHSVIQPGEKLPAGATPIQSSMLGPAALYSRALGTLGSKKEWSPDDLAQSLGVNSTKAGQLLDLMEREGFVGPADSRGIRSVVKPGEQPAPPAAAPAPAPPPAKPTTPPTVTPQPPGVATPVPGSMLPPEALYKQAVQMTREFGKGSASVLQRRLGIGYGEAIKLLDRMQQEGILHPPDAATNIRRLVEAPAQPGPATTPPTTQPSKTGATEFFEDMKGGFSDTFVRDTFARLQAGKQLLGEKMPNSLESKIRDAYEQGLIKSPDDIRPIMDEHFAKGGATNVTKIQQPESVQQQRPEGDAGRKTTEAVSGDRVLGETGGAKEGQITEPTTQPTTTETAPAGRAVTLDDLLNNPGSKTMANELYGRIAGAKYPASPSAFIDHFLQYAERFGATPENLADIRNELERRFPAPIARDDHEVIAAFINANPQLKTLFENTDWDDVGALDKFQRAAIAANVPREVIRRIAIHERALTDPRVVAASERLKSGDHSDAAVAQYRDAAKAAGMYSDLTDEFINDVTGKQPPAEGGKPNAISIRPDDHAKIQRALADAGSKTSRLYNEIPTAASPRDAVDTFSRHASEQLGLSDESTATINSELKRQFVEQGGQKLLPEFLAAEEPAKPAATGAGGLPAPPAPGENYRTNLSDYTPTLYHESSPEGAFRFIDPNWLENTNFEIYFANTENMAIGQGRNRGVMLEFKSEGIGGQVNKSKPTWRFVWDEGEAEFIASQNSQHVYQKNLQAFTIKDPAFVAFLGHPTTAILNDLVKKGWSRGNAARLPHVINYWKSKGWTQTANDDGSITLRKPGTEPAAGTAAAPETTHEQPTTTGAASAAFDPKEEVAKIANAIRQPDSRLAAITQRINHGDRSDAAIAELHAAAAEHDIHPTAINTFIDEHLSGERPGGVGGVAGGGAETATPAAEPVGQPAGPGQPVKPRPTSVEPLKEGDKFEWKGRQFRVSDVKPNRVTATDLGVQPPIKAVWESPEDFEKQTGFKIASQSTIAPEAAPDERQPTTTQPERVGERGGQLPEENRPGAAPATEPEQPTAGLPGAEGGGGTRPVRSTGGGGRTPGTRTRTGDDRTPDTTTAGGTGTVGEGTGGGRPEHGGPEPAPESTTKEETEGSQTKTNASDYVITDADQLGRGGAKTKFRNNIEAIRTLRQIQLEGRSVATPEEQSILVKFIGWGQFPQLFKDFEMRAYKGESGEDYDSRAMNEATKLKQEWAEEAAELKSLLNDAEYDSAERSVLNAHYTSAKIVEGMWDMVKRMGFRRGRVLEPSMGTGNFFGLMPTDMRGQSKMTGVELDSTTGAIAQLLYPNFNIQVKGFQKLAVPNDFFDVAISNVPFGKYHVYDREYSRLAPNSSIHDYFFLKSVDKVHPGGLVVYITSTGTMDKGNSSIRELIAKKADLVAAFRLPDTTFEKTAGTAVVTDIIILRKRAPGDAHGGEDWMSLEKMADPDGGDPIPINEYYYNHPDNILGRLDRKSRMYGRGSPHVSGVDDFAERFQTAINSLPKNIFKPLERPKNAFEPNRIDAPGDLKEGNLAVKEGKVYSKQGDHLVEQQPPKKTPSEKEENYQKRLKDHVARIEQMTNVRGAIRDVFASQLQGKSEDEKKEARTKLGKAYDTFVKKYGNFHETKNTKAFADDPDGPVLLALEDVNPKTGKVTKRSIFKQDVITHAARPDKVDNPADAISVSLAENGNLSLERVAALLGLSEDAARDKLLESGLVYDDPSEGLQTKEQYLSGNVRRKLYQAEEAAKGDPAFQRNVDALKPVQPEDIPVSGIRPQMGAAWIPPSDIKNFAQSLIGGQPDDFNVSYIEGSGRWFVNYSPHGERVHKGRAADSKIYGTDRLGFMDLLQLGLSGKAALVYDTEYDADNKPHRVFNKDDTDAANGKLQDIKEKFRDWIWADDERRDRLHRYYNDTFNNIRTVEFDGSHLTVDDDKSVLRGMDPAIKLRPHQINAIWRAVQDGRLLADHEVGTGKTMVLIGSAMELRRMGLAKKPAIAALKANVEDVAATARRMYPGIKLLTIEDFSQKGRRQTVSRVATGDYDLVILTHDNINQIGLKGEVEAEFIREELEELERVILAAEAEDEASGRAERDRRGKKKESYLVKRLRKQKEQLQARFDKAIDMVNQDTNVTFEDTGIDFLLVDESHEYKSLPIYTTMDRVKGIPTNYSQRATRMWMRTRWLLRQNNNRGVVFATGTPVSNTLAEMFNVQRYLQYPELVERGIQSFDAWTKNFAEQETKQQMNMTGEFQNETRLDRFINVDDLLSTAGDIWDTQFAEDLPEIKRPEKNEQTLSVPMSKLQRAYMMTLRDRMEAIKTRKGPPQKGDDIPLVVNTDARKMSIDMRMVMPTAPDDPLNKINKVISEVLKTHKENPGKTQLIFSDVGVNPTRWGFHLYQDIIDKLVKGGIPRDQIIDFSKFSNTKTGKIAKQEAQRKLREGEALIGIGGTKKLGTGVNVQDKLISLYHVDSQYVPANVEQRNGRGWRQGNENKVVNINYAVTLGSIDARLWNLVGRKLQFNKDARKKKGKAGIRDVKFESGEELSPDTIAAIASGNPLILEKIQLDDDVKEMQAAKKRFQQSQYGFKDTARKLEKAIKDAHDVQDAATADQETYNGYKDKPFAMTVGDKTFGEGEEEAAIKALQKAFNEAGKKYSAKFEDQHVGRFLGFDLIREGSEQGGYYTSGKLNYPFSFQWDTVPVLDAEGKPVVETKIKRSGIKPLSFENIDYKTEKEDGKTYYVWEIQEPKTRQVLNHQGTLDRIVGNLIGGWYGFQTRIKQSEDIIVNEGVNLDKVKAEIGKEFRDQDTLDELLKQQKELNARIEAGEGKIEAEDSTGPVEVGDLFNLEGKTYVLMRGGLFPRATEMQGTGELNWQSAEDFESQVGRPIAKTAANVDVESAKGTMEDIEPEPTGDEEEEEEPEKPAKKTAAAAKPAEEEPSQATAATSAANKYYLNQTGTKRFKAVEGTPVTLPDLPNFEFFFHEDEDGWSVVEASTGYRIGSGTTKDKAVDNAQKEVERTGIEKTAKLIETARATEPSPRYEAQQRQKGAPPTEESPPAGAPGLGGGSQAGAISNLVARIKAARAALKKQQQSQPQAPKAPPGGFADAFTRNFSRLRNYSEALDVLELFENALKAASSSSRAFAIMRKAVPAIEKAFHGPFDVFATYLIESRLRGIRGRAYDIAQEVTGISEKNLVEAFNKEFGLGDILDAIGGKRDFEEDLREQAETMLANDDFKSLRHFLQTTFADYGDKVGTMFPGGRAGIVDRATQTKNFQDALDIYKENVEKPLAESHEANEGIFSDALGPLDTYYPLSALNEQGDPAHPVPGVKTRAVLQKPRNPARYFATGLAEQYSTQAAALSDAIQRAFSNNDKAELLMVLEKFGLASAWRGGQVPPGYTVKPAGPLTRILQDGKVISVKARQLLLPIWLWNELQPLLEGRMGRGEGKGSRLFKALTGWGLAGLLDPAVHSHNILKTMITTTPFIFKDPLQTTFGGKPLLKALDVVINIASNLPIVSKPLAAGVKLATTSTKTEKAMRNLLRLAEAGALPEKTGSVTYSKKLAEQTGAKRSLHPEKILAPFLYGPSGVDTRARLALLDILDAMKPNPTNAEIYDFVNNLGIYNYALESAFGRFLKDYGVGPFYSASSARLRNGIRALTFQTDIPGTKRFGKMGPRGDIFNIINAGAGGGGKGGGGKGPRAPGGAAYGTGGGFSVSHSYTRFDANAYRIAQVLLNGLVGTLAMWALIYYAYRKKWPYQEKETRLLEIPLTKEHRKSAIGQALFGPGDDTAYIGLDPFSYVPNALHALGIAGYVNTVHQGGVPGQGLEKGVADAISSFVQPAIGAPGVHLIWTGLSGTDMRLTGFRDVTGSPSFQFARVAPKRPPGVRQFASNIADGILGVNSFVKNLTGIAGVGDQAPADQKRSATVKALRLAVSLAMPGLIKGTANLDEQSIRLARQRQATDEDTTKPVRDKFIERLRSGESLKTVRPDIDKALKDGRLAPKDLSQILSKGKEQKTVEDFKSLIPKAAVEAFEQFSPENQQKMLPELRQKRIAIFKDLPEGENRKALVKRFDAAIMSVVHANQKKAVNQ